MLAMERLPPSQPFSTALPLSSPTLQSPRSAGLPPPLCMHGSPVMHPAPALHVSLPGPYPSLKQPGCLVHPHTQSSSSLSSVQTPPPYDRPQGLPLVLPGSVFSPTGAAQTLPLSPDREHHHGHATSSPRLVPPTSLPHLERVTASSSTSSSSTEGSARSPTGM